MIPQERRWKWVKTECLPDDLKELMDKLSKKKGKGSKAEKKEAKQNAKDEAEDEQVDENVVEFVTTVRTRNDLLIDYSLLVNVKERLEILT